MSTDTTDRTDPGSFLKLQNEGDRLADVASHYGARVILDRYPWGGVVARLAVGIDNKASTGDYPAVVLLGADAVRGIRDAATTILSEHDGEPAVDDEREQLRKRVGELTELLRDRDARIDDLHARNLTALERVSHLEGELAAAADNAGDREQRATLRLRTDAATAAVGVFATAGGGTFTVDQLADMIALLLDEPPDAGQQDAADGTDEDPVAVPVDAPPLEAPAPGDPLVADDEDPTAVALDPFRFTDDMGDMLAADIIGAGPGAAFVEGVTFGAADCRALATWLLRAARAADHREQQRAAAADVEFDPADGSTYPCANGGDCGCTGTGLVGCPGRDEDARDRAAERRRG